MRVISLGRQEFAELSTGILEQGGSFRFEAHGASMLPFVRHGDLLTVQSVDPASLQVGDVILYRSAAGRLVVHRLVACRQRQSDQPTLVARGDASPGPGEPVPAAAVLGCVVSARRGERTFNLDRGTRHAAARLWAATAPIGPLLLRLSSHLPCPAWYALRQAQSFKPYRVVARHLIGSRVHYRTAWSSDAYALSRLYGYQRFPELDDPAGSFARHLEALHDCGRVLIATVGNTLAGAVVIRRSPDDVHRWWLASLLVRPRYRGAGIGQSLSHLALETADKEGASSVCLYVCGGNRPALHLYRRLGFCPAAADDDPHLTPLPGQMLLVRPNDYAPSLPHA